MSLENEVKDCLSQVIRKMESILGQYPSQNFPIAIDFNEPIFEYALELTSPYVQKLEGYMGSPEEDTLKEKRLLGLRLGITILVCTPEDCKKAYKYFEHNFFGGIKDQSLKEYISDIVRQEREFGMAMTDHSMDQRVH